MSDVTGLFKQIAAEKRNHYVTEYTPTDEQTIGIGIAEFFEWDGTRIIACFANALEDANYHTEAARAREWLKESE